MSSTASVGGDERLRLFLALRVPDDVLDEIERWQRERLGSVRVVPREHLHVTLAFLGHRPAGELEPIVGALRAAAAGAGEIRLTPVRYRETRSVGMLVLADDGARAARLAGNVQERLEQLGVYHRERRDWLPHLTVARWRDRPRLRLDPPPVRTFVPSDAAAYLSRLHPGGARYEVLESVALGG
ncbi:MAG TPA: RNA 2',3'-cyclic phosphodiesterase [Gaiellaceae bacterium]|jgi:2'-5' RNA ligase|nr:RNA 2',3'-cyclic phosphodiesterase [Gaiellaceae bacterium]